MNQALCTLHFIGLNGESFRLPCPREFVVGDLIKLLIAKYNYPFDTLVARQNPEEIIPMTTPVSYLLTPLKLVSPSTDKPQYAPFNLRGRDRSAELDIPNCAVEAQGQPIRERRKIVPEEKIVPQTSQGFKSSDNFSVGAGEYNAYAQKFSQMEVQNRRAPGSRVDAHGSVKNEHTPLSESFDNRDETVCLSSFPKKKSSSPEKCAASMKTDILSITCRIIEFGTSHTVNLEIDATVLDLVEKLKKEVKCISSPITVVRNRKVLPLAETKLFNLGIRGPCTVYVGTGEFSNSEIVSLTEVEEVLSGIEAQQIESLSNNQRNTYYEELMSLILSADSFQALDGEWRQRRKAVVRRITLLQDQLKSSNS